MKDEAKAAYRAWLATQDPVKAAMFVVWENLPQAVRDAWDTATQSTLGLLWGDQRCDVTCDHGSQCTLRSGHKPSDRHETEHGCVCYGEC